MKLQIIFYHHLILHIENAELDDMPVISSELLGEGAYRGYLMLYHKSRCVAPYFRHLHTQCGRGRHSLSGGGWWVISTSSCWLPGELQNVFNRQNVPVKERRLLACQLFFFYCISQLCWALTRLQRGTVESWELTESLFLLSQVASCHTAYTSRQPY